jgi:drug/metabolite transporter (DMT)-like permease
MFIYFVAALYVIGLAAGQILFKLGANSLSKTGSFFAFETAATLLAAVSLYGGLSIAWVLILQKIELGRIYPVMALTFIFIPLASHFVFGERFPAQYFAGIFLIMVGIIVIVRS